MSVASEIAAWRLAGLELTSERCTVEGRHHAAAGGDTPSTTSHESRIVVLRIEPPLEIDLAGSRDASALVAALGAARRPSMGRESR